MSQHEAVAELKRHHVEDVLRKGLERRHTKEELVQLNIMKGCCASFRCCNDGQTARRSYRRNKRS